MHPERIVIKKNVHDEYDVVRKVLNEYTNKYIYFSMNGGGGFKDEETAQSFYRTITQQQTNAEVIK